MGRVLDVKVNDRAEQALLAARERLSGRVSAWRLIAEARRTTPRVSERALVRALVRLEQIGVLRKAKRT